MNTDGVSAENLPVSARIVEQDAARDASELTGDLAPMLVPRIVAGSLFFVAVAAIAAVAAWRSTGIGRSCSWWASARSWLPRSPRSPGAATGAAGA
jgi:hypothetical protein